MRLSPAQKPHCAMSVSGRYINIYANIAHSIFVATCIYLAFVILYLLASNLNDYNPALAVIHFGSAISLLVFWRLIRWGGGRYDTFGAALLLLYAFFKIHASVDTIVYGTRIDQIYHTVPIPRNITLLFLKSEALNHFGILLLVSVWRRVIGHSIGKLSFTNKRFHIAPHLPVSVYILGITISVANEILNVNFGVLNQITGILYKISVISIYFIASRWKGRYEQAFLAIALAVPAFAVVIGTGMKSEMFFPFVPAVLIIWFRFNSFKIRSLIFVFSIVGLAYSQLYIKYVREVSWGEGSQRYSAKELVVGFITQTDNIFLTDGLDSISSRVNMTNSRAITVAIADARGFEPANIFGPIPGSLIPRMFWPGKPVLAPGAQHTLRIHNLNIPVSEAWSATASGVFSEFYLGGGYIGWLLGVAAYGILLAKFQLYTLRKIPGYGHLTFSVLSVYLALRFEEEHVVYLFTGLVFTLIVLVAVVHGSSFYMKKRRSAIRY